jgi:hypothetical protein
MAAIDQNRKLFGDPPECARIAALEAHDGFAAKGLGDEDFVNLVLCARAFADSFGYVDDLGVRARIAE